MIEVKGLSDLIGDLKRIDLEHALNQAYNRTQKDVVSDTRRNIAGLDIPRSGEAARGVTGGVRHGTAVVDLEGSNPIVRAAVLGTVVHHVFGHPVLASTMTRRVYPKWIGKNWKPERTHALGPAIDVDDIATDWLEAVFKALGKAFDG